MNSLGLSTSAAAQMASSSASDRRRLVRRSPDEASGGGRGPDKWLLFWRFLGKYGLGTSVALYLLWWNTLGAPDTKVTAETLRLVAEVKKDVAEVKRESSESHKSLEEILKAIFQLQKIQCDNAARNDSQRSSCNSVRLP